MHNKGVCQYTMPKYRPVEMYYKYYSYIQLYMYLYQFINLQCTAKVFASVMQQMGNTSVSNKPINIQHQRPSHQSFWSTSRWNSPDITIVAWLPIYSKLLTHEWYGEENEANLYQSWQFISIFTMKQVLKLSKVPDSALSASSCELFHYFRFITCSSPTDCYRQ